MKITFEQREKLTQLINESDWENTHEYFDTLCQDRLKKLDPEFFNDLNEMVSEATFWYA